MPCTLAPAPEPEPEPRGGGQGGGDQRDHEHREGRKAEGVHELAAAGLVAAGEGKSEVDGGGEMRGCGGEGVVGLMSESVAGRGWWA